MDLLSFISGIVVGANLGFIIFCIIFINKKGD